jgi:glycosyltransferase involved in cell wall biosynthesis
MWLCSQLGAREHYAIPRALFRQGSLERLLTDAWVPPRTLLAALSLGLGERFHFDLTEAPVQAWNNRLLAFELAALLKRLSGWRLIIARNHWFQRRVASFLSANQLSTLDSQRTLFSYSYSALEPLRFAKSQGWRTVLGQIDPGLFEEDVVAGEAKREPLLAPNWKRAPADYWKSWREECNLSDRIIVNSQWSFDALVQTGIPKEKLSIIPLAFENNVPPVLPKEYPKQFTATRPLRVLFLGQICLRKGIARLLKVARSFQSQPIEFMLVGPIQITIPEDLRSNRKIRWFGPVARNEIRDHYEKADVFLLPTLSDGFALSQLEAIAYRLPLIASRRCGAVVIDRVNGLLLEEPTAAAIAAALQFCLHNPNQLAQFSKNATVGERFGLSCLGANLCTHAC